MMEILALTLLLTAPPAIHCPTGVCPVHPLPDPVGVRHVERIGKPKFYPKTRRRRLFRRRR